MKNIAVIIITSLLVAVIALQILAALNIFPRQEQVEVCPVDAISMQDGKAVIDRKKCIGCRRCVAGVALPAGAGEQSAPAGEVLPGKVAEERNPAAYRASLPEASPRAEESKAPAANKPPSPKNPSTPKPAPPAQTEASEAKHRVDPAKCIGCGLCTIYCPTGAIKMVNDKAVIDPAKCINCGLCKNGNNAEFKGCPVKAISGP